MQLPEYLIGIDLGTTNSSLAYVRRRAPGKQKSAVNLFPISQVVKPGVMEERDLLPSFLYLAGEFDLPPQSLSLPWDNRRNYAVGYFARSQGQKVPGRLVHSAKSWLCHGGVDRYAPTLPWGSVEEVPKISPVDASARYLSYMRECWNHFHAGGPHEYLEKQPLVLTVPAAFDEVARNLTLEAAARAGLENVVLLEEPMAAFYYWIYSYHRRWPQAIQGDMLALVCDVGGGTTDFSLIEVIKEGDIFRFERVAVGDHLLLGGDNMDIAMALYLESQVGKKLDPVQFVQLVTHCSRAKETLWQKDAPGASEFAVVGRGSSVIGGSIKFRLSRSILDGIVLDGFFPFVPFDEEASKGQRIGFREWGLPYEAEPAISRHLLAFLKRHLPQGRRPDLVLFNGGVLIPDIIRERVVEQISRWFSRGEAWRPEILANDRLDLAVSYGAAYFNLVRSGEGIRIAGGSPRSFFLGIRSDRKPEAMCVLPFGAREGDKFHIDRERMQVLAGQPVSFPLYSSTLRKSDKPGDIAEITPDMIRLAPIQTVLRVGKTAKKREIPVEMHSEVSEIGTLDLWLSDRQSDRRWRLQFLVRSVPARSAPSGPLADTAIPADEISAVLARTFAAEADYPVENLTGRLEQAIGHKKDSWSLAANRKICDFLLEMAASRTASAGFEARWLNLVGFCLRPGLGAAGDEWRVKRLWSILQDKVCHDKDIQCWVEWWVLWRRIAGGLGRHQQLDIFRQMSSHLLEAFAGKKSLRKHVKALELAEMWRTAASLENLPEELRCELGEEIVRRCRQGLEEHELWALGRLGSRTPLYGQNIIAREKVVPWIRSILSLTGNDAARCYSLAQLARKTGDRAVDIDEDLRAEVLQALAAHCPSSRLTQLSQMVEEVTELNSGLQKHYFGDSFPPGLAMIGKTAGQGERR